MIIYREKSLFMKAYGGYLPLELNQGKEYYESDKEKSVLAFNSCKAAIYYALILSGAKRVFIPHYICSSMIELIERLDIEVLRYYIDEEFMPVNVKEITEEDILLIVNYFGMTYQKIKSYVHGIKKVIVDNSQAFFAEPILREGIYNVYSCKKFIGTPDGGYLITKKMQKENILLEQDYSSDNMNFCVLSIEYGTDYAYNEKKQNDLRLLKNPRKMSLFTQLILKSADYENVINRRLRNFRLIEEEMGQYNRLKLGNIKFVPYYYPLLLDHSIQKKLLKKKIYAPVLWKELLSEQYDKTIEQRYASQIAFLPMDQRYDEEDILEICNRAKECL